MKHILLCRFIESANSGEVWKVVVIEEGMSKNGKFYTKEALEESVPLFENSKVCYYEWKDGHFDHIPPSLEKIRPEGFPLQTAGILKDAKYETVSVDGREVTGITAKMHLFNTDKVKNLRQTLSEGWKNGLKDLLGLSINAAGPTMMKMLNGVPVQVVQGIKKVFSTDIVTQPAAGGSLINLLESYNNEEGGSHKMFTKILEALKKLVPNLFESIDIRNVTQEEIVGVLESLDKSHKSRSIVESVIGMLKDNKLDEAEGALLKAIKEAEDEDPEAGKKKDLTDGELKSTPDGELTPEQLAKKKALLDKDAGDDDAKKKEDEDKAMEARMQAFEEKQQMRECRGMLSDLLGESKLPSPIKDKIKASFEKRIFKESDLKESIKIERDTLSKLFESKSNLDLGDGMIVDFDMREPVDRLQASMDLTFGYNPDDSEKNEFKGVESFGSLREAYVAFTDDPQISGQYGPAALARLQEATSSTFSYALGYTMNRRMLKEYKKLPETWKEISSQTNLKDFKMTEVIQWGGFGVLPTVIDARTVQGTPTDSATPSYPELGFPADSEAKYAAATKGGIVTVTRRMIINDDLKILKQLPKKLASASNQTLNQFVFDLFLNMSSGTINGGTIYDSVALFATAHGNYQTTAFGYDSVQSLLDKMWYQVETGYASAVLDDPLTNSATTINITGGTGQYFKAGDMAVLEGEIVRITSVSTDALTVSRGQYGTTGAEHAAATVIKKATRFLGIDKPNLWVPRSLYSKALELKNSDKNPESAENATNVIKGLFEIGGNAPCPYLNGDENNYYMSSKPSDVECVEVGFLGGKTEPEILVQDNPTVGNVFTYDTIKYKVRHEYGGAIVDYRGAAAGIVS